MAARLLLAVATALLAPGRHEARLVSRCELRDLLDEAIKLLYRSTQFKEKMLRYVVCELERLSGLDSGTVHKRPPGDEQDELVQLVQLVAPSGTPAIESKPEGIPVPKEEASEEEEVHREEGVDEADEAEPRAGRRALKKKHQHNQRSRMGKPPKRPKPEALGYKPWRDKNPEVIGGNIIEADGKAEAPQLHGIFLLSNKYACRSVHRPSADFCRTKCRAFNDDYIEDDLACFVRMKTWPDIMTFASEECKADKNYFAECD